MKSTILRAWRHVLGFMLFFIAWAFLPLFVCVNMLFVYRKKRSLRGYFLSTAESLDRWANREFRAGLNALMIERGTPHTFGNIEETISSVLGKNQQRGTLKISGKILCKFLDFLEKDHCKKSIKTFKLC